MKNEEKNVFQNEIKFLYKKFHFIDKPSIKILYQFCEFDAQKTYKVTAIAKTLREPAIVVQNLIKHPEKSEDYIDSLVKRYDNEIGQPVDILIKKAEEQKKLTEKIPNLQYQFFEGVPSDTIQKIMTYLDPYSLKMLAFTNSLIYKISESQALSQLYRSICLAIFSLNEPILPLVCRFQSVKQFVMDHPEQYGYFYPNFKNAVTNNLRSYIWKMQSTDLKLENDYYKQFGSYQNLFLKCPRVNFNGYYMCRHKYVKIGQKNQKHIITPIHIIYYYRYLRFVEDGSIIYHVCNKKLKPQQIQTFLGNHCLTQQIQEQGQSYIGEFMQLKNNVYLKAVKENTVFSYQLEIRSTDNKISNQLKVLTYKLELIDPSYVVQNLYEANPNKEEVTFEYFFNKELKYLNGPRIQACSL